MPTWIIKYLPHIVAAAVLAGGGLYLRNHWISQGEAAGRAIVQKAWDSERAEIAAVIAAQEAENKKKEEEYRIAAKRIQDELQSRLRDADRRSSDLARSLRQYKARERARSLSEAAGAASRPDSAPGESGDSGEARTAVDLALEAHLGACARDAERLGQWQSWWDQVSK